MKLAASNIGWSAEHDNQVLRLMAEHGFTGIEIAPTRIFPINPYENLSQASTWAKEINKDYNLEICSMQSIWYGQQQRIVESAENRQYLLDYTKKAIRFANEIGCKNLVFGCPRNRVINTPEVDIPIIEDFLWCCAEDAKLYGVVIALEPNPPIYNTNFINTTAQAIDLLRRFNHPALKLNLDFGTVIENGESLEWIAENGDLIHHVHISEPGLKPVQEHLLHRELSDMLKQLSYNGFISIEQGSQNDLKEIESSMEYVKDIF